jgi:hypothetical protein
MFFLDFWHILEYIIGWGNVIVILGFQICGGSQKYIANSSNAHCHFANFKNLWKAFPGI